MVSPQKFLMNFPREKTKEFFGRRKGGFAAYSTTQQSQLNRSSVLNHTVAPNTVNQRKIRPRYELIFPTNPTIHSLQSDLIIVGLIGTPTPVFTVCIT
jgi:hypothetical protein